MNRAAQLIERLSALQRSEMRNIAQNYELQMIHIEVLNYLTHCNQYSDTTQALSEYLGLTKGSLSQTVGFLESDGYLQRSQDTNDRRIFHLKLTPKGRQIANEFESQFFGALNFEMISIESLETFLAELQKQRGLKSFGLCGTCRFNSNPEGKYFVCNLTKERLSNNKSKLRCREHEAIT